MFLAIKTESSLFNNFIVRCLIDITFVGLVERQEYYTHIPWRVETSCPQFGRIVFGKIKLITNKRIKFVFVEKFISIADRPVHTIISTKILIPNLKYDYGDFGILESWNF